MAWENNSIRKIDFLGWMDYICSMKKFMKSCKYALWGVKKAYGEERNLKIMVAVSVVTFILCIVLPVSYIDVALIIICNAACHAIELINTSIEHLCNHIHDGYHERIGVVKDIAAGATLIVVVLCGIVGVMVFIHALI